MVDRDVHRHRISEILIEAFEKNGNCLVSMILMEININKKKVLDLIKLISLMDRDSV